MKQKIEWYKEVLELEPGSRIFFPLARLLAAEGQIDDAMLTLKQGLGKHPDHVEARLMLVELLSRQKAAGAVQQEVDDLGALFSAYPGFWQAWAERLSSVPTMHDASMAMRFFAAALQGQKLSWGHVIEKGLQALMGQESPESAGFFRPRPDLCVEHDDGDDLGLPAVPAKGIAEALATPYENGEDPHLPARGPAAREIYKSVPGPGNADPAGWEARGEASEEDDPEEAFSLRTRSMAEVLAEQGDYAAAAEIYQELMQTASDEEKPALAGRIEELSSRAGAAPVAESAKADDKSQTSTVESTRLVGLLESLAQRLEDRTR